MILATDGVNDPTRAWTSQTSLRSQMKVFDTSFCTTLKSKNVTVAILNTPYYPMTWAWGYQRDARPGGQPRRSDPGDDIPIALSACAGTNFVRSSDPTVIQSAFTTLLTKASPVRLTN